MKDTIYKHVFFDLDHTLWDFEKNATETLNYLYQYFKLIEVNQLDLQKFVTIFHQINRELWSLHDAGKITKDYIRKERFNMVFAAMEVPLDFVPATIGDKYLELCPTKPHVIPFAHKVLDYLKDHYVLHIITNGFEDVQQIKIKSAQLEDYFIEVITADFCGYKKPSKEIFVYALEKAQAIPEESIMIGDNLETDIIGAKNANIDQVYYNPDSIPHQHQVTYEIKCLSELLLIL